MRDSILDNPQSKSSLGLEQNPEDDFGIDLDLLQSNLELSFEERLQQHHAAYLLLIELESSRSKRVS